MQASHPPTVISKFEGLYNRGNNEDCPLDHLLTALNNDFTHGDVRSRIGSSLDYTLANIKRARLFKKAGEATRVILLDNTGSLFDASVSLVVPILTVAGMTDFALYTYYNRAYISPHNGITGLPGQKVYVYDGTSCRAAAGAGPTGFTLDLTATVAGHVEAGTHLVAVAFESASGYITRPGPAVFGQITVDGTTRIDIADIPVGPPGTVARHILCTAAIETYSGIQSEYELFFVSNARIADNTTVSSYIDFYDNELVDSADDLLDQYTEIPAGVGFSEYASRLVVYGVQGSQHTVLVSKPAEPESISEVDGLIETDPKDNSGIKNCRELRGQLYIYKSLQCYTTQDNGDAPNTWTTPTTVDKGFGAEPDGIADVLDAKGANCEQLLIANRNGLNIFNGSFVIPELTWKIDAWWKRINKLYFHKVQPILDPINHLIYIAVPLDAATTPNYLFVGYYPQDINAAGIKWSVWKFDHDPSSICVDVDFNTLATTFRYASVENNVYKLDAGATSDNGVAFETITRFPYVPILNDSGKIYQVGAIRTRIRGSGILNIIIYGQDDATSENVPSIPIALAPGRDYARQCNFQGERASVQFSMSSIDEYFILNRMVMFTTELWAERPA